VNSHPELVLWRDLRALAPVSQKLLHKVGDIPSGDRDVLDRRADNVSLRDRDRVWLSASSTHTHGTATYG
jgi:hypothetical protein